MGVCSNCGNEYDRTFKVEIAGAAYQFDCFECAIQLLAPTCHHCHTRIIGHGVQDGDMVFCCANCARAEGRRELIDRQDSARLFV